MIEKKHPYFKRSLSTVMIVGVLLSGLSIIKVEKWYAQNVRSSGTLVYHIERIASKNGRNMHGKPGYYWRK